MTLGLEAKLGELVSGLMHMHDGLGGVASGAAQEAMLSVMAERGKELIAEGFATQTAPSGATWAPPARDYGHPLLDATGDMKASADCISGPRDDAAGFSLTFEIADEKAIFHQKGTRRGGRSPLGGIPRKSGRDGAQERQHIPARPMLFEEGERPERWITGLEAVGQASLDGWINTRVRV